MKTAGDNTFNPDVEARISALGNAGFLVSHGLVNILFDPFFQDVPGIERPANPALMKNAVILITHDHWDHLNVRAVIEAAAAGAVVLAPEPAIQKLGRRVPAEALIRMEPDDLGARTTTNVAGVNVTAFRTRHGQAHNSYLVETGSFRIFDDGDNEHTDCLDPSALQGLDALMLCPWQGSQWVEFIEKLAPRHWFLMHMTEEELDDHEHGRFLPDLCDRVPMDPIALRPGRSFVIRGRNAS